MNAIVEPQAPPIRRICNLEPSRDTIADWTMRDFLAGAPLMAAAAPPAQVDLRENWWTIGDQLSTGSCVGWAVADGLLRHQFVKAGRLQQNDRLSTRYLWMASKETDEFISRPETFIEEAGTSLKAAIDVARKYGVVTDALLPFNSGALFQGKAAELYMQAATRRVASFFNLRKNLNEWKAWLAKGSPIVAGLSVDATWRNARDTQGRLDQFQLTTVDGGHAVCIVGYTADRFIIRNSWGTTWGDQGFGFASHAYINAAFFNEAYVVTL